MSSWQATTGPTLIEGVKRIEAVMVHPQQRAGFAQLNLYAMKVDRSNRNCYNCGGFGHLARHCRNRGIGNRIGEGRRLEYGSRENNGQRRIRGGGNKQQNNLNGEQDLILLD